MRCSVLMLVVFFLGATSAWANPIGLNGTMRGINPRLAPQTVVNPPFMYDPDEEIYDWKIKDHPDIPPCYYDENYGQWFGNCNMYLTAPGYSVTIPNHVSP